MNIHKIISVMALAVTLTLTNNANNISEINIQEQIEQPPIVINERDRMEQMASRGEIRSMIMEITAYCEEDGDITATGTIPRPGIVAIDPSVIPLNSILYIDGVGVVKAEDVDDEEGFVVDLYITKRVDALEWGRQKRKVYIIKE